ncbi:unnamed protein product [Mytilus coruscus]|uniref:CCHC-type domain-containing protein n=1 Tax=Mytilus coruscus TaxID=42192 RepID=A0A6J8C606_MYTCO|nr:unnamed protein product [Mytilus coruscus]
MRERLRYNNKVTNCLTGDRIIICDGPLTEHIPRSILIGKYRATIIYRDQPRNNPQNMKCSKCLQEGHQTKDCINDWVCRSCGQEGHKQNACTKDTFSDAPDQSDKENNKESHETSDADDETSESETGTDATQISVKTNNAEICESASATGREGASAAECEGVSTTGCEDDNGQSQSIINPPSTSVVAKTRIAPSRHDRRNRTAPSTGRPFTSHNSEIPLRSIGNDPPARLNINKRLRRHLQNNDEQCRHHPDNDPSEGLDPNDKDQYFYAGVMIAPSLVHGRPASHCFTPAFVQASENGPKGVVICLEDSPDF